jgi:hypothetical protein
MIKITVQGENMAPNTAPKLTNVRISSPLCSHILGVKNQARPMATASRIATITGRKNAKKIKVPQEKAKPKNILSNNHSLVTGIK